MAESVESCNRLVAQRLTLAIILFPEEANSAWFWQAFASARVWIPVENCGISAVLNFARLAHAASLVESQATWAATHWLSIANAQALSGVPSEAIVACFFVAHAHALVVVPVVRGTGAFLRQALEIALFNVELLSLGSDLVNAFALASLWVEVSFVTRDGIGSTIGRERNQLEDALVSVEP